MEAKLSNSQMELAVLRQGAVKNNELIKSLETKLQIAVECLKDIDETAKRLGVMSIQQITRYALEKLRGGE